MLHLPRAAGLAGQRCRTQCRREYAAGWPARRQRDRAVRAYRSATPGSWSGACASCPTRSRSLSWCARFTHRILQLSFGYIDGFRAGRRRHQLERDRWLLTQTAVRASRGQEAARPRGPDLTPPSRRWATGCASSTSVVGWVPETEPSRRRAGCGWTGWGQSLAADLAAQAPAFRPVRRVHRVVLAALRRPPNVEWGSWTPASRPPPDHPARRGRAGRRGRGFRASHYQA